MVETRRYALGGRGEVADTVGVTPADESEARCVMNEGGTSPSRARSRRKIIDVFDVAEQNLCCGCGVCASVAPAGVAMVDDVDQGRRPIKIGDGTGAGEALAACPGFQLRRPEPPAGTVDPALLNDWGAVRAIWEGFAADPAVRFAASSGGIATALAAFALDQGFDGVVHIGADEAIPYRNRTYVSRTRSEVERRSGSRYAPASPGDGLGALQEEAGGGRFVFVGKPCDVAGAHMAARIRPQIDEHLGLTIAIFCAGTPSLAGTLEMLRAMGVTDPSQVTSLRFRGHGWPGDAVAETQDGTPAARALSYAESWGEILQLRRPWRCRICPDHTGEFADIAVGDPWYRPTDGDPGRSLVVARTERGEQFVRAAIAAGVVDVEVSPHRHLPASQPNLARARARVWGQLVGMRMMRMVTPEFREMGLLRSWLRVLPIRQKATSIAGTIQRVRARGLAKRRPVRPYDWGAGP